MMGEKQSDSAPGKRARLRAMIALAAFAALLGVLFAARPDDLYLWVKALHIIAVISWMAALLYMPRLFIYHTDAPRGSPQSETFKIMEQRLLKVIMNPAMMITWGLGLYLAWDVYGFRGGWLHAKLLSVLLLTLVHVHYSRAVAAFGRDENRRNARYWRLMNEVPTLLMILIVILVVVKPF
ncbi:protoporphyrinogen oxidase HemJ [Sinorhizobium alkalisoli]|uniref:Protoporphyrinogen IX oxidase n=1 Tax=Sinorhizobium alkalisoli TaxID=1752398 RepID=A0A1E3VBT3_9HYPH|nr:protoporphyrinogen oxidase HemJ [Sinorhizobium alkalisoli]MCG5485314.1 protoporphyrinogen oxidase HemJ [Sinorhizobium meliloti]ODR91005.1 TIGR00701 family protein [Sinorhizobium alkalisoli]